MGSNITPAGLYYNTVTGQLEQQDGQGGAANVAMYAWSTFLLQNVQLTVDSSGNLMVVGAGGGGGSNAAAGPTGSAVPASAGYTGWNSGGNLLGVSLAAPMPIQPGTGTTFSTKTPITANSPTAATVGVTSAQILASNASRKGLIVVNTSSNTVSLGLGASAVLSNGVTLTPQGTFWMDEFSLSTAAVNAIASAASSNVSIQEYQ
jgi:hypothetical protein